MGYSPWDCKEPDMTEQVTVSLFSLWVDRWMNEGMEDK